MDNKKLPTIRIIVGKLRANIGNISKIKGSPQRKNIEQVISKIPENANALLSHQKTVHMLQSNINNAGQQNKRRFFFSSISYMHNSISSPAKHCNKKCPK